MPFRRSLALCASTLFAATSLAQGVSEADPARGQQIATQVCAACHAADGNSTQPANPVLAEGAT